MLWGWVRVRIFLSLLPFNIPSLLPSLLYLFIPFNISSFMPAFHCFFFRSSISIFCSVNIPPFLPINHLDMPFMVGGGLTLCLFTWSLCCVGFDCLHYRCQCTFQEKEARHDNCTCPSGLLVLAFRHTENFGAHLLIFIVLIEREKHPPSIYVRVWLIYSSVITRWPWQCEISSSSR